jgi:hypothetical protein
MEFMHAIILRIAKYVIALLAISALTVNSSGQQLKWIYKIGGLTAESGSALALDIEDNIYDLTNFMGTVAVSNEIVMTSNGNTDILVRKSSSFGALIWIKKLGSKGPDFGYDVIADNLGNVYVTGVFQDSLRLDDQVILTGDSRPTGFIITLNSNGDFVRSIKIGSTVSVNLKTITRDNAGNITVSGEFEGILDADPSGETFNLESNGSTDIFYARYNASGAMVWAYSMGSTGPEQVNKHVVDNQGNIYLVGDFRNRVNFFTGQVDFIVDPAGMSDCFVLKLTPNGHTNWVKGFGGIGMDSGLGITTDPQGNVIVAGRFSNTVDFSNGNNAGIVISKGAFDAFVLKLSNNGDFIWVTPIGGSMSDLAKTITTNFNGIIFVGGTFRDSVNFDLRPGTSQISGSAGGDDVFYLVLNQDGTYNDHFILGGLANEQVNDIALRFNGDLISTGAFGAVVDFDPSDNVINIISTGGLDAYLLNFFVCVNPYIKDLRVVTPEICWGERGLVQIAEGFLNGATQWSWQRNDCSNITFASGDFLDTRLTSDISYFVKGSGGCVTTDNCLRADIRVFVDTLNYRSISLCEGDSIIVGDNVYYTSGVYIDSILTAAGCDSVIVTELEIFPTYSFTEEFTICHGDSLIIGNTVFINPGTYTTVLQTAAGCDSIISIQLNVIPSMITMQDITICEGDVFTIGEDVYSESGTYTYVTISDQGCEDYIITRLFVVAARYSQSLTLCEGDSILIGTNIYTEAGLYTDSFTTETGCDSIVTTTITKHPVYSFQQEVSICDGDSIMVGDKFYSTTGIYRDTLQSVYGCDSIIISEISILPVPEPYEIFADICRGESWQVGNNFYTLEGIYIDTFQAANGCDSLIITHLRVLETLFLQDITICRGDSFSVGDSVYYSSGSYINIFQGSTGCDSVLTTILRTISPVIAQNVVTICLGESISIGSNTYLIPGIYRDTFISQVTGCDSILITVLNWHQTEFEQDVRLCSGESIQVGNNVYDASGTYRDTFVSGFGCDSIIISNILVLNPSATILAKICEGEVFVINGNIYNQSGTYYNIFTSVDGCDSIVTIILNIIPTIRTEGFFEICKGDSIILGGVVYYDNVVHSDTVVSSLGCDSISHITLKFIDFNTTLSVNGNVISVFATDGATYRWYSCADPEVTLSTENNPQFTTPVSGQYAVEVDFGNCKFRSDCADIEISSSDDVMLNAFRIYPNPAKDFLTISAENKASYQIIKSTGALITKGLISAGLNQLDISSLNPGVYTIQVKTANNERAFRFVKQ